MKTVEKPQSQQDTKQQQLESQQKQPLLTDINITD